MKIDEKKLKRILQEKGMTKYAVCSRGGISSRTIAKITKGEDLREDVVSRIAAVIGVSVTEIALQNEILLCLQKEESVKLSGGLYHETQIRLTYNSNHIEGNRLTEDQTRYIFETKTIGALAPEVTVDDILETTNHFRCIDSVILHAGDPLTEGFIRSLHAQLKAGTNSAELYGAGEYKKYPNTVGGIATTPPDEVEKEMRALLNDYNRIRSPRFEDLVAFHYSFECIHPFQDGNGRLGRLIFFKECLRNGLIPSYIDDHYKSEYYNGLRKWKEERGFLIETFRFGQDLYKRLLDYFKVPYQD